MCASVHTLEYNLHPPTGQTPHPTHLARPHPTHPARDHTTHPATPHPHLPSQTPPHPPTRPDQQTRNGATIRVPARQGSRPELLAWFCRATLPACYISRATMPKWHGFSHPCLFEQLSSTQSVSPQKRSFVSRSTQVGTNFGDTFMFTLGTPSTYFLLFTPGSKVPLAVQFEHCGWFPSEKSL